jgi:elongation factor G
MVQEAAAVPIQRYWSGHAVEVTTPEAYLGTVIGDLNARRGHVQAMNDLHVTRSFRRWCRCRRCSATSAIYAPKPRTGVLLDGFSTPTRDAKNIAEEIIQKARGE